MDTAYGHDAGPALPARQPQIAVMSEVVFVGWASVGNDA